MRTIKTLGVHLMLRSSILGAFALCVLLLTGCSDEAPSQQRGANSSPDASRAEGVAPAARQQPFGGVIGNTISESVADWPEPVRAPQGAIDGLDEHIARYDEAAAASIDAFIEESANGESSADNLITLLKPLDRTRTETLHEIVRVRQSMLELLSDSEWDQVFS